MIDVDHAEVPGLLGSPEVDTDGQVAPVPRGQEPARLGVARLLRQRLRIEDQSFGRRNAVADHDARYRPAGIRAEVEIALVGLDNRIYVGRRLIKFVDACLQFAARGDPAEDLVRVARLSLEPALKLRVSGRLHPAVRIGHARSEVVVLDRCDARLGRRTGMLGNARRRACQYAERRDQKSRNGGGSTGQHGLYSSVFAKRKEAIRGRRSDSVRWRICGSKT